MPAFSIHPLMESVSSDLQGDALHCNSPAGRAFTREIRLACDDPATGLPAEAGLYLWISHRPGKPVTYIYVGKSGGRGYSLRSRNIKALRDERAFFWASIDSGMSRERIKAVWLTHYPRSAHHLSRSLLKVGATHILWRCLAGASEQDLMGVERHLIRIIKPIANIQRPDPPDDAALYEQADQIFKDWKVEAAALL